MIKQLLILITFSFVCQGQTKKVDDFHEIDFKDITEINGLVYYKADTTLVSGKIIRYNKKNIAKSYVFVSNGKPDSYGWIHIKNKYEEPEKKMKTSRTRDVVNEAGIVIGSIEEPILKYYDQMSDRNDISNEIQSNINSSVLKKPVDMGYKDDVLKNDSINNEVKNKNGVWEKYYSNGKLKSKGVLSDGKEDGLYEEYYENGQLKRKTNYNKGVKDGLWVQYHSNGELWSQGHYNDGRMIGEWNYYDENGKLVLTENYNN